MLTYKTGGRWLRGLPLPGDWLGSGGWCVVSTVYHLLSSFLLFFSFLLSSFFFSPFFFSLLNPSYLNPQIIIPSLTMCVCVQAAAWCWAAHQVKPQHHSEKVRLYKELVAPPDKSSTSLMYPCKALNNRKFKIEESNFFFPCKAQLKNKICCCMETKDQEFNETGKKWSWMAIRNSHNYYTKWQQRFKQDAEQWPKKPLTRSVCITELLCGTFFLVQIWLASSHTKCVTLWYTPKCSWSAQNYLPAAMTSTH